MKSMSTFGGMLIVAALLALGIPASSPRAQGADLKTLMGDNFGHMHTILIKLIRSDYSTVAEDVDIIRQHAVQLRKTIPDSAKTSTDLFMSMAYNLEVQAKNLEMVAEIIHKHDTQHEGGTELNIDYLRSTAASHFGNIITACVSCHNQFRRKVMP